MASLFNNITGRCILYGIRTFISLKVNDFNNSDNDDKDTIISENQQSV